MDFTPSSGIPVAKLGKIAKMTGQNAGQIDDLCLMLEIDEAQIDENPKAVADVIADSLNEFDALMEQF